MARTPAKKSEITEGPVKRAQFRATMDRDSMDRLIAIGRHMRLKRTPAAAHLVTEFKLNKKLDAQLIRFYREQWPVLEPRRIDAPGQLFNWPVEVDDELKRLSWDAIGTGNKSETLRVILAFFVKQYGIKEEE